MMKIIAVYHNKGGVGKTTVVVNLAAALSRKGKRVLVVDLDSQANTTYATGLIKFVDEEEDNIKDRNILNVLRSEEVDPIQEVSRISQFASYEIDVVPSHIDLMRAELDLTQQGNAQFILVAKLKAVESLYDIVIIDTPPSLNLYAKAAVIAADYLIIPSDLKPFANQGLSNVKEFIKDNNSTRKYIGKEPIRLLGVLPSKISTHAQFVKHTLPKRIEKITKVYEIEVMETCIFEREDLAKCTEQTEMIDDQEIPNPSSVFDFKRNSMSAEEFESLGDEVIRKIGVSE